jgi:methionyl-tRNA synthetase
MPEKMALVRRCLGMKEEELAPNYANLKVWFKLEDGSKTELPEPIFPRVIYTPPKEETAEAPAPKKSKKAPKVYEPVSIEEVGKVQLKTAEIIAAEPVPDADKLLRLQIRMGDEERQIVSGIAQWYKPEELVGKTIVVIANLKPAEIRGVESKGMLLAAKAGNTLRLVTIDGELQSGATIG